MEAVLQQVLVTSAQFAPFVFARLQPAVRPMSEAESSDLGRRLPRFERQPRHDSSAAVPAGSFLDHLRRAAA